MFGWICDLLVRMMAYTDVVPLTVFITYSYFIGIFFPDFGGGLEDQVCPEMQPGESDLPGEYIMLSFIRVHYELYEEIQADNFEGRQKDIQNDFSSGRD